VTLTDVAPTLLDVLGASVPTAMPGRPFGYVPGPADLEALARLDRDAAHRERVYLPTLAAFVAVQALVYLLVSAFSRAGRPRLPGWWRPGLRLAVLGVAAFPLATFLTRALAFLPGAAPGDLALLVVVDAAVVAVAVPARRSPLSALGWILGATTAVLVVDVATGARLQPAAILGYSPHTAGRFHGLGNTAFAVLGATAILAGALHLAHAPRRREALAAVAAMWALVVVVDAAPVLGRDVGGILSLVPVMGLAFAVLAGRRLTGRRVAYVVAATLALLALATAADLARPPGTRTHLGRLAAEVAEDGVQPLLNTIARRASVTLEAVRTSVWAWAVPVVAALLLHRLVWRRWGTPLLPAGSPVRIGAVAVLAFGLLGSAVNDSGVVVLAVALVYVAPLLALPALADDPGRVVLREPPPPAPGPTVAAGRVGGAR